jgi:hypothetical protein
MQAYVEQALYECSRRRSACVGDPIKLTMPAGPDKPLVVACDQAHGWHPTASAQLALRAFALGIEQRQKRSAPAFRMHRATHFRCFIVRGASEYGLSHLWQAKLPPGDPDREAAKRQLDRVMRHSCKLAIYHFNLAAIPLAQDPVHILNEPVDDAS